MIVSVNSEPSREEFGLLISSTLSELNNEARESSTQVAEMPGRALEPYIRDVMATMAVGTVFENSIELIGGQKFPDIVANKFYGIEVKTTTQNHWKTTGNSVLESTRVNGVERIFMLFAKLAAPIEFKCRPYEDVLAEVVVTHSPRYLIDMNLELGRTIFDKISMPYDTLRHLENPIKPIVEYYRSKLNPGEELWWMDTENSSKASNIIIRIWNNLSTVEQIDLKIRAMILFPEVFGSSSNKFSRLSIWLATNESVVCPNVRDLFTAGGRGVYEFQGITFSNVPRIHLNLLYNISRIVNTINQITSQELSDYWKVEVKEDLKLSIWADLVIKNTREVPHNSQLDIERVLLSLLTDKQ